MMMMLLFSKELEEKNRLHSSYDGGTSIKHSKSTLINESRIGRMRD